MFFKMRRATRLLLAGSLVIVPAVVALAHTEFETSMPADQQVVEEPVDVITITFTLPVTIVGDGFEVLDPQGNIVHPRVEIDDDTTFRLILAEPLAGGDVGVRYEVAAEDGHVVAGGFSFTVSAPVVTTTSLATTTTRADRDGESSTTTTTAEMTPTTIGPTAADEDEGEVSLTPLLVGLGVVLVGGAGLYVGIRSRS